MQVIILALIITTIFILVCVEPIIFNSKNKNGSEYGSAKWSNKKEIKKNFKEEKVSDINQSGFHIWYSKNFKKVWFDNETPHYIYLGSTGSGKTLTAVIPLLSFISMAGNSSCFVTDPKGEIYEKTSKMFKDRGYEIYTIDFRNPELSNHINLLEPIINEFEKYMDNINLRDNKDKSLLHLAECNRLIISVASMIVSEENTKDPFWNNSAKNMLVGFIHLFLEEYKEGRIERHQISLSNIKIFQNSTMKEGNLNKLINYLDKKDYNSQSKLNLIPILSSSENTYKSICSVFGEKLNLYGDLNVQNITSNSDFDFNVLGKKKSILYFIIPDEDKTYYNLISIVVSLMYKELVKLANTTKDKKLPRDVNLILDEFANMPPIRDIDVMISVARSRGIYLSLIIQAFSQLTQVYGKETAQTILDNCGLCYLKSNTQNTLEAISKMLGRATIGSSSVNSKGKLNSSVMGRDLMTADEIKQLHHKTIIFPSVGYPILRDTVPYYKLKSYISGTVPRISKAYEILKNKVFTVDNLSSESLTKVDKYKEIQKENDKIRLKEIETKVTNILCDKQVKAEYKLGVDRYYLLLKFDKKLNGKKKVALRKEMDSNIFQYFFNEENKTIEIYLKL